MAAVVVVEGAAVTLAVAVEAPAVVAGAAAVLQGLRLPQPQVFHM